MSELSFTRNPIWRLILGALPKKMKRLTLLASFAARVSNVQEVDAEIVHQLNQTMRLSMKDAGIAVPILVSNAIWLPSDSEITTASPMEERVAVYVRSLVSSLPSYAVYDSAEEMFKDFMRILNHVHST